MELEEKEEFLNNSFLTYIHTFVWYIQYNKYD